MNPCTPIRACVSRRAGRWLVVSVAALLAGAAAAGAQAQSAVLTSTRAPQPADNDELIPVCKTDLRLSGSLYNSTRPKRSFAIFQVRPDRPGELYRAGMRVGAYELVAIEPRGVLLRDAHGECWLRLVGDPVARAHRAAVPPPPAKPRRSPKAKASDVAVIGHR
jgi:hypothetical protein